MVAGCMPDVEQNNTIQLPGGQTDGGVSVSDVAPLDTDGDGIPDYLDKCPNEPEDFDGYMDEDGCPEENIPASPDAGVPADLTKMKDSSSPDMKNPTPDYTVTVTDATSGLSIYCWDKEVSAGLSFCGSSKDNSGKSCWSPAVWLGQTIKKCGGPTGSTCLLMDTKPMCCWGDASFPTNRKCIKKTNYDLTWLLASATTPDAGTPDSAVSSPDVAVVSSDSQVSSPDTTVVNPDSQIVTPDSTVVTSDSTVVSPDSQVITPDSAVSSLDTTVVNPDSQIVTPDSAVVSPDSQVITPDSAVSSLDVVVVTPDSMTVSPDATIFTPDIASLDASFVVPSAHKIYCWDNLKTAGKSYCDSQKDAVGWQCWSPPVWSGESKPKCLGPAGSACGSFIAKPECCVGLTTSFLTTRQCVKVLGRGLSWVL